MSEIRILDASAALAHLYREKGLDRVEAALDEGPCCMTAVNVCEVLSKLCEAGMPPDEAQASFDGLHVTAVDFDAELARLAAFMRVKTKPIGASLGDRACLALAERAAQSEDTPIVYTAETGWAKLKWPFKVVTIR